MGSFSATHWIIFGGIVVVLVYGLARFVTSMAKMRDYWKERGKRARERST